eukprot:TRINITY_DN67944_c1_g7_i1.p1 TRINITY_DN67944_c1_g7~~TRINITY_DN67944_c1_g7_i1.p1  ORF type:complete len:111 (+),score=11.54 TRINITY_DN67944_c1_g7_i1:188-520(+)
MEIRTEKQKKMVQAADQSDHLEEFQNQHNQAVHVQEAEVNFVSYNFCWRENLPHTVDLVVSNDAGRDICVSDSASGIRTTTHSAQCCCWHSSTLGLKALYNGYRPLGHGP